MGIEKDIITERDHKTKRNYEEKDKKLARTIVLRLADFKEKSIKLKNVKKLNVSDVYIDKDTETVESRKKLWEEVCIQRVNFTTLIIASLLQGIKGKKNLTKLSTSIF